MRRVIPFAPWQTAYFLRWLRDMSDRGWALQTIKGVKAVFVPAAPGGQIYAAAAALVAAACFAVDCVLFHGVLSPEKWDDMSYEECLHRAAGRTVLLYVIVVAAPIAALLYSFLSLLRT